MLKPSEPQGEQEMKEKEKEPLLLTRETLEEAINADKDVFVLVHVSIQDHHHASLRPA